MKMPENLDPTARLRQLSTEELIKLGEDRLREHLLAQAIVAHQKYAPLALAKLDVLLKDPACVRYPTRLVFELGAMALHQFAQPDFDYRNPEEDGRLLYLRPRLREHPELVVLAVAYMLPVINYGDIIADAHCVDYGSTLLGMLQEEFYQKICALADFVRSEPCYRKTAATGSGSEARP